MLNSDQQQEQDRLILLLSEKEKICLNSYIFNSSSRNEAYKVAKDITKDIDPADLTRRANNWYQGKACKAYLDKNKAIIVNNSDSETYNADNQIDSEISKEQLILTLSGLINKTADIKLKSELIMKLTDIKGYKKQDQTKQEEQIKYYLPLRCESCSYKNKI